jgi:RNA polymerase sigma-70 factor, ECF subfamily
MTTSDPKEPPKDGLNSPQGEGYGGSDMQTEATRLMTAIRAGDHEAFGDLERTLRSRAFHVARSLVGSQDDAMELCQETFLKVFRARESYDPAQPFLPWFHRILRNTCFSFLRKHRRLRKRSLTVIGSDGEELDFEIVDSAPGPATVAETGERSRLLTTAMEHLSARDREILALRQFDELSYREIAQTLGIPEGTVMSRLYHARRRLAEALAPLLDEIPAQTQGSKTQGPQTQRSKTNRKGAR